ncbi:MAG: hypothetical protein ACXVEE_31450 [Polyangiales bacterium]
MDDPSRRGPPPPPEGALAPYAPAPQYPQQPYPQPPYAPPPVVVQSLPGMPPIQPMPGVSVHIQNVVVPQPMQPMMYPQPAPMAYPQAQASMQRGVVDMMTDDAAHRTREAVARRGPARVLSFVIGGGSAALAVFLLLMIPFGASVGAVLAASIPLAIVSVIAFALGARAGHGVASHHLEQAILRLAAENRGVIRVVALAQSTGRPLRECQTAIDAMVSSGHATIEADDAGGLVYRVPDLEPRRALPAHSTEILAEPPFREGGR